MPRPPQPPQQPQQPQQSQQIIPPPDYDPDEIWSCKCHTKIWDAKKECLATRTYNIQIVIIPHFKKQLQVRISEVDRLCESIRTSLSPHLREEYFHQVQAWGAEPRSLFEKYEEMWKGEVNVYGNHFTDSFWVHRPELKDMIRSVKE